MYRIAFVGFVVLSMCMTGDGLSATPAANDTTANDEAVAEDDTVTREAAAFLDAYLAKLAVLGKAAAEAAWKAANTGDPADFEAAAATSLALRQMHSSSDDYATVRRLQGARPSLSPEMVRALALCEMAYRENQLPPDVLKKIVDLSSDLDQSFNTYRAELDGARHTNNDLLEMLRTETDTARREAIWSALKQVGAVASSRIVELAKLRNEAARRLGFQDYWDMQIRLQEHDPVHLLALFEELDRLTREPFAEMKEELDAELSRKFGLPPEALMPWHYDNPFFQAAPASEDIDFDVFFEKRTKEDLVEIARRYFAEIGLPVEGVLAKSDLYEREGKDQHAFCITIDGRIGDTRVLCNMKPTAQWMDTMLHELGHAVYELGICRSLPYNVSGPAHAFTTEGVAMYFGALASDPAWLVRYADADPEHAMALAEVMRAQRRREQLIFARWTMVMLHFERALYADPDQDLNTLWWDLVERYQFLKRPQARDLPDWASKPHFVCAPVYYHNYMLGELFAAQLRATLAEVSWNSTGAESPVALHPALGAWMTERVFALGALEPWPAFVQSALGGPLSAQAFAEEVKTP